MNKTYFLFVPVVTLILLFPGCVNYPNVEPQEYLWFSIDTNVRLTDKNVTGISFGYQKDGIIYTEWVRENEKIGYNYSLKIPVTVPKIGINTNAFIDLANKRISSIDKNAKFKELKYLTPKITKLYFKEEKPAIAVIFHGDKKGYLVLYDAKTNTEILFKEKEFVYHPMCLTMASIQRGRCIPDFNINGEIPYSTEIQYYWKSLIEWIQTNTEENASILTWWDYYSSIGSLTGRRTFPESNNAKNIVETSKFLEYLDNEKDLLEFVRRHRIDYVVIDWTMISKSAAPHFIATSNVTEPFEGYSQCRFSPYNSILKAQLVPNEKGKFDSVRKIVFFCSISGPYENYIGAINFEIKNDRISSIEVYPLIKTTYGLSLDAPISWDSWKKEHGGSILGVQSLEKILGNALNYGTSKYIEFSPLTDLVFVPKKFEGYAITKLYLADHLDEYKKLGLTNITKPKHFELVDSFLGDKEEDNSFWGHVKIYEVI